MREGYEKRLLVAVTVLAMALPLLAQQEQQANETSRREIRSGAAIVIPGLTAEGREIIAAHRHQQRGQMQARAKARRQEQMEMRKALAAEEDPHKQLDILEARVKARSASITEQREAAQQARLDVYKQALAVSGVEDADRQKIISNMQANQQKWMDTTGNKGDTALGEIAKLRQNADLTKQDVRRVAGMLHGRGRGPQARERRAQDAQRPQRPRGQRPGRCPGAQAKPQTQPNAE